VFATISSVASASTSPIAKPTLRISATACA
jgi:hypothetical protein